MRKIGVFFDWDGVLCDSLTHIWRGVQRAAERLGGTPPSFDTFLRAYDGHCWVSMYQSFGCPELPVEKITQMYRALLYESYPDSVECYPGATELLAELTVLPDTIVGIISGEQSHRIEMLLRARGVVCDFVEGNQIYGKAQTIDQCLRDYDLSPSHTLFIDDIARGVRCGKEAGVATVGWIGQHPEKYAQLVNEGADYVLGDYDELRELITEFRQTERY